MLKITITKGPVIRLFDRMPMPRARVRSLDIPRRNLKALRTSPFLRKISKIQ